jgi:putative oxidoreductase
MNRIGDLYYGGRLGVSLLLLRFVVGLAFIFHGLPLVHNVAKFAEGSHLPVWLAAVGAYTQVIGGGLLILGFFTPLVALLLTIEMLVALFWVHLPAGDPFVNVGGRSFELAAVYLVASITFLMAGPGAYSLDAWLVSHGTVESRVVLPRRRRRRIA